MTEVSPKTLSAGRLAELLDLSELTLLSEQEESLDTSYLESMIAAADKIDDIDADHLSSTTHAFGMTQRLRADVVTDQGENSAIYHNLAPNMIDRLYCVPAVINK